MKPTGKILSLLQCRITSERIRIRVENSFPNWKQQQKKTFFITNVGFFLLEKSQCQKNPKTGPLKSKTLFQTITFKQMMGIPFYLERAASKNVEQCRKKSHVFNTNNARNLISPTGLKKNRGYP